ncbi:hypothetical protein OBJ92_03445 [Empedobacter falsenii]
MKLAIHNGISWNKKWIDYCQKNNIEHIVLNCYDSDIINQLKINEVTHLMWHFHHSKAKDILMARNVLYSAKNLGIKTFPDFETCWHFDDKISQKYLLESVDAPLVPSYAFFDKKEAYIWLENEAKFPIVAKLRRGAGSYNVILLKDLGAAKKYVNKMFSTGIHPTPGYIADAKNKLKVAGDLKGIKDRLKKAPKFFKMVMNGKKHFPVEKGYVYFQDFIPNNKVDIRIAIIDNHLWGFKRLVRENDFRASGSGKIEYSLSDVPTSLYQKLFNLTRKLKTASIAYDLVKDNEEYLIVEISYGFVGEIIYNAPGYWNENLEFIESHINPEDLIIQKFIN